MKIFFSLLLLISFNVIGQTWDKFINVIDGTKEYYDVDETSLRSNAGNLILWVRVRDKSSSSIYLDKLMINCINYKYAIVTRNSVDKNGMLIKTVFDYNPSSIEMKDSADSSIIRRFSAKYCPSLTKLPSFNQDTWLSLGRGGSAGDPVNYFVNSATVAKEGIQFSFTSKIEYLSDKKLVNGKAYNFILQDVIVNCSESSFAVQKSEYYNSSGQSVDKYYISRDFIKFSAIIPDSFVYRVRDKFCDSKNSTGAPAVTSIPLNKDAEDANNKCIKLGYRIDTLPFDRCIKQLLPTKD